MSKVIRISDETFIRLQEHAEPLVDTPATVIERLLDFYELQLRRPENQQPKPDFGAPVPDLGVRSQARPLRSSMDAMQREPLGDYEYPSIVPSLFLTSVSPEHVEATVMNSVPFTKAERLIIPRQRIKLRRALEGASTFRCSAMAESNRAVFESMRPGDYVLITAQGATELDYLARVVTKFESEELGRELWSGGKRDLLSLIYAIEDVRKLSVDKAKLKKALGYDPKDSLVGVKRVDQKSLETQSARFGSVEGLLSNL